MLPPFSLVTQCRVVGRRREHSRRIAAVSVVRSGAEAENPECVLTRGELRAQIA